MKYFEMQLYINYINVKLLKNINVSLNTAIYKFDN